MANEHKGPATINDVARLSGVSKRTVSRVLNNSPKVNPETREKILQVIDELNYSPSKQARGLASSRSYMLGLLYDEPNAVVIHSVQKGILSVCSKYGYEMVVHPIDYQSEVLVSEVLGFVSRSKLDGLIIMPPISGSNLLADALVENEIPYVRLAAKQIDVPERIVISDDRTAMKQVADLFHEKKRQRVAIILGPSHRLASAERYEGLADALAEYDIEIRKDLIAEGDFSYETARECAQKLLGGENPPDAIFASNDQMAIAAMHTAEDLGLRVPEDLIVVGYDDEPMAARLRPSLTTLSRPNADMACTAAMKLIATITGRDDMLDELPTRFVPQLICRESA